MNPQETHSKVYRRKDTLEFTKADFGILQLTWSTDGNNDPVVVVVVSLLIQLNPRA